MTDLTIIKSSTLTKIADSIRSKKNISSEIPVCNMESEILSIETGIDVSNCSLESGNELVYGTKAFNKYGELVDGTIQTKDLVEPSISISGRRVTAKLSEPKNAIINAGKKTASMTLPSMSGDTYIPGNTNITIPCANKYILSDIVMAGDTNLKSENIISGKTIFGVAGNANAGRIYTYTTYNDDNAGVSVSTSSTQIIITLPDAFSSVNMIGISASYGIFYFKFIKDVLSDTLMYLRHQYGSRIYVEYGDGITYTVSGTSIIIDVSNITPNPDYYPQADKIDFCVSVT